MKICTDFISNSSSCSFIVYDAKSAIKLFKKEFGNKYDYRNIPYGIDDVKFSFIRDMPLLFTDANRKRRLF